MYHPLNRIRRCHLSIALALACTFTCIAVPAHGQSASDDTVDTVALVRDATWNELHSSTTERHPFRFRLRKADEKGSTTKEIIQTRDGDVAHLIAVNDKPLTPETQQRETERLNNLLAHPELQANRQKKEKADSDRGDEMVRLLPDAFLYTNHGIVPGPNGPSYRLTFEPNPKFLPPDREAEVYHGMAGELWIDVAERRLTRLDGHLISDVNFGWGVIGRLYKGGTILVEQKDVGMHHWEQIHLRLDLNGKILMVKPLRIQTTEDAWDFHPVEKEMTYQDAIKLLQREDTGATEAELSTPQTR